MPDLVFSSASWALTITRSWRGLSLVAMVRVPLRFSVGFRFIGSFVSGSVFRVVGQVEGRHRDALPAGPVVEPVPQRRGGLAGLVADQQRLVADVLVQVRP